MVIFIYNQKLFVRRRLHRCRLRHEIRTIKTRPNNPLRFLQHKNSYPSLFGKRFTFSLFAKRRSEHKSIFTTNNTHQNQKIYRLNQSALILTQGLTTPTLQCTVKPLFFFFFIKTQPFNKKPKQNYIKQPQQTTHTISQSKTSSNKPSKQTRKTISPIVKSITQTITTKITHTISQSIIRPKQPQQAITKNAMFLNIKISQMATCFELTEIAPLIKTQYNRKKQNNRADTLR